MIELNKIYNMDCLEGLKLIENKSVDLICVDPPYFQVMLEDWKNEKYDWDKQWATFEDYLNWCDLWFKEFKRILKENGSLYIFSDDKICAYIQIKLDKLFTLKNNIVWVKPNNMTIRGWNHYQCFSPITERILFYSNEDKNLNQKRNCSGIPKRTFNAKENFTDVWTFNMTQNYEKTIHPTQKPLSLIKRIIETSSKKDDLVLDCFMGSGTTAFASKIIGRNFIGFEMSQEYCEKAERRLNQSLLLNY